MRHSIAPRLGALLAPATFAALEGRTVAAVRTAPFTTADSASGSSFLMVETLETPDGPGARYLVKRIGRDRDWLMRATDDPGREALLWRDGVFGRLPPVVGATILAVARDEPPSSVEGNDTRWALLLRDVTSALLPARFEAISAEENDALLDGIAALHAAFFADPATLTLPYLCDPTRYYTALAPATGRRDLGATPVAARILRGWELLPTLVPPEVAATVAALHDDPRPLTEALARFPHTLLHGDLRRANLALERGTSDIGSTGGSRVLLLDWQLAHAGPPAADLAWYLADPLRQPISTADTLDVYRRHLARRLGPRFDPAGWEPTLALGLLGGLLRFGWLLALFAVEHDDAALRAHYRGELVWWAERAHEGTVRLRV